jgi:uncharacterized protein (UPF0332 family)
MQRATATLEAAKLLAEDQYWNDVANRIYYACYYAISAHLTHLDIETNTHKGLKVMFHKHIIKNGLLEKKWSIFFDAVWNKRQEGDYSNMVLFDGTEIAPFINEAEKFIEHIRQNVQ